MDAAKRFIRSCATAKSFHAGEPLRAGRGEHAAFTDVARSDRSAVLAIALFVSLPIAVIALLMPLRYWAA